MNAGHHNVLAQHILRFRSSMFCQCGICTAGHILKRLILRAPIVQFAGKRLFTYAAVKVTAGIGTGKRNIFSDPLNPGMHNSGKLMLNCCFRLILCHDRSDPLSKLAHPLNTFFRKELPAGRFPIHFRGHLAAHFLFPACTTTGACADFCPEQHIKKDAFKVEVLTQFLDLYLSKGSVFHVVGAALSIASAGGTGIIAINIDYTPFRMMLMRPVVVDQAVISDDVHAVFMAQLLHTLHLVLATDKSLVHFTALGRPIAQTDMALQIQHGRVDVAELQMFHIVLRIKLRQEFIIPVFDMHVHQVSTEFFLIPLHDIHLSISVDVAICSPQALMPERAIPETKYFCANR